MNLPGAESAIIPEGKIIEYLLNLGHPEGRDKALFFMAHGFNLVDWTELGNALLHHAITCPVAATRSDQYGIRYAIEGPMPTPDGRMPTVRSIWMVRRNETTPRLVTAYPHEGGNP